MVYLQSGVGSCSDGVKEGVIDWVRCDGESTVYDPAVYVHAEVDLEHIVVLQDHFLTTSIWGPMRANIVQAESSWEAQASFERIAFVEALMANQCSNAVVNLMSKSGHGNTWLGNAPSVIADLTVDFSGFAVVAKEVVVHVGHCLEMAKLFRCGSLEVVILRSILDYLSFRIWLITEDVGKRHSWRDCLRRSGSLLRLLLATLSLLLGASTD